MAKVVFGLSAFIGLAILAIAVIGSPPSASGEAHATDFKDTQAAAMTDVHCALREISLDQGYGVTRKVMRRICQIAE